MNIKFTKFPTDTNWVSGVCDGYKFSAKLFDENSSFGINKGRVSKLQIITPGAKGWGFEDSIVNYDRGWDIRPGTPKQKIIYRAVLKFLEESPKRFES